MRPIGWERIEAEWWPVVAASLPLPWPREAVLMDLRWWAGQVGANAKRREHQQVVRPGRPALAARWGWSDKLTRSIMRDEATWGDPIKVQRRSSAGPDEGQPGSSGGPVTPTGNADNEREKSSTGPAEVQPRSSAGPAQVPARVPLLTVHDCTDHESRSPSDPDASEPDPAPEPDWDAIDAKVTATREAEIAALTTLPTPKPLPPRKPLLPGMKHAPSRTPHPLPPLLRRDGDRREPPAGSPDASSGDVGAPRGAGDLAGAPAAPGGDLPPGAGGHAAPTPGPVLGPPVAAGVDDDVSPVRVGDRVLPGDLPALLSGMPSGDRVALALVKGGTMTTRALLRVRPDQLRYTKGLGGQGADNVVRHLTALGVEPGCLSPELEDERVWDQCLTGPPPQPGEPTPAYLRPRHLAALTVVGGRLGIRRANQFDIKKLREKFLNHCKATPA